MKFGAFVVGAGAGASSTTPNEIISTMLETSFLTFSGRVVGRALPVKLRLQRYMARANSGKRSCPDFVVSDNVHICARLFPSSLLLIRRSFALSPLNACSPPVALLNSCSNLAWSCAVMKLRRTLGILVPCFAAGAGGGGMAAAPRNELAMSLLVMPVGAGRW